MTRTFEYTVTLGSDRSTLRGWNCVHVRSNQEKCGCCGYEGHPERNCPAAAKRFSQHPMAFALHAPHHKFSY
jgi:hypothetical protein